MQHQLLSLALLAVLLASCNSNKQPATVEQEPATGEVTQRFVSPEEVVKRVTAIYDEVLRVYPDNHELALSNDSLPILFCSQSWNLVTEMVNEMDGLLPGGELGFFESDYWIQGQDWDKLSVSDVKANIVDGDHAEATFALTNAGKTKQMRLAMVYERDNWMIDNFINETDSVDWRKSMERYMEQQKVEKEEEEEEED